MKQKIFLVVLLLTSVFCVVSASAALAQSAGTVTVTLPNSGQVWSVGEVHTIAWTKTVIKDSLNISITNTDTSTTTSIVPKIAVSKASYLWTIPSSVVPGNYTITITDLGNSTISDTSPTFKIQAASTDPIFVYAPVSSSIWTAGKQNYIRWTEIGVANVDIMLNNIATTASTILHSKVSASRGYYLWNISKTLAPGSYTVTVSDSSNSDTNSTSDIFQIITNVSSIKVTGAAAASTTPVNSTLQMGATVLPANASNPVVIWSVKNVKGTATIDSSTGLLTPTTVGTVTVTATATDDSGVKGTKTVTITAAATPCTESNWTSTLSPSTCPSSGKQTTTWKKSGTCSGGVTHPSTEATTCNAQNQGVACTGFKYSNWTVCDSTGNQTRTVTASSPQGCSGGAIPVTSQTCTYVPVPPCADSDWTFTLSPTVCPSSGQQTKTWTSDGTCSGGVTHPATETTSCTYPPVTCTSFTYSDWSACPTASGPRTRTVTSALPAGCTGGNPDTLTSCSYTCVPFWTSGAWGTCTSGHQARTVTDSNGCGLTTNKPDTNQNCTATCTPSWTSTYGICTDGQQTVTYADSNHCGVNPINTSGKIACPSAITLNSPATNDNWPIGATKNITWTSTGLANVSISLYRSSTLVAKVASNVDATADTYSYSVGTNQVMADGSPISGQILTPGQYTLRVVGSDNSASVSGLNYSNTYIVTKTINIAAPLPCAYSGGNPPTVVNGTTVFDPYTKLTATGVLYSNGVYGAYTDFCSTTANRASKYSCGAGPTTGTTYVTGPTDIYCPYGCQGGICMHQCVPDCAGKACGAPNSCGGTCTTGSCSNAGQTCYNNQCCTPDCTNKRCVDDDGCGNKCGCPTGKTCMSWAGGNYSCDVLSCPGSNQVVYQNACCTPNCTGKACGADNGCGGTCQTGTCATGTCKNGQCVCTPNCVNKLAGADDGCGGVCANKCTGCTSYQKCFNNKCCTPWQGMDQPINPACGQNDGCGGSDYGWCSSGLCFSGKCLAQAQFSFTYPAFVAYGNTPDMQWTRGQTYTITWTSTAVDKIYLSAGGNGGGFAIAYNIPSSSTGGSYSWTIPTDFQLGVYRISAGYSGANTYGTATFYGGNVNIVAATNEIGVTCGSTTCHTGMNCVNGQCVCPSINCVGKPCGSSDGCGGLCQTGTCPSSASGQVQVCVNGQCAVCYPSCTGKACGAPDGCGNLCQTGSCQSGYYCVTGQCVCSPNCHNNAGACGSSDGCGGTCLGTCPSNGYCYMNNSSGAYECLTSNPNPTACSPHCNYTYCGASDGCYGECTGWCQIGTCSGQSIHTYVGGVDKGYQMQYQCH